MANCRWELTVMRLVKQLQSSSRAGTSWPPDRLAHTKINTQDREYAVRYIAVLVLSATCCAGLVGLVILLIRGL
jgi:hypothetical protein